MKLTIVVLFAVLGQSLAKEEEGQPSSENVGMSDGDGSALLMPTLFRRVVMIPYVSIQPVQEYWPGVRSDAILVDSNSIDNERDQINNVPKEVETFPIESDIEDNMFDISTNDSPARDTLEIIDSSGQLFSLPEKSDELEYLSDFGEDVPEVEADTPDSTPNIVQYVPSRIESLCDILNPPIQAITPVNDEYSPSELDIPESIPNIQRFFLRNTVSDNLSSILNRALKSISAYNDESSTRDSETENLNGGMEEFNRIIPRSENPLRSLTEAVRIITPHSINQSLKNADTLESVQPMESSIPSILRLQTGLFDLVRNLNQRDIGRFDATSETGAPFELFSEDEADIEPPRQYIIEHENPFNEELPENIDVIDDKDGDLSGRRFHSILPFPLSNNELISSPILLEPQKIIYLNHKPYRMIDSKKRPPQSTDLKIEKRFFFNLRDMFHSKSETKLSPRQKTIDLKNSHPFLEIDKSFVVEHLDMGDRDDQVGDMEKLILEKNVGVNDSVRDVEIPLVQSGWKFEHGSPQQGNEALKADFKDSYEKVMEAADLLLNGTVWVRNHIHSFEPAALKLFKLLQPTRKTVPHDRERSKKKPDQGTLPRIVSNIKLNTHFPRISSKKKTDDLEDPKSVDKQKGMNINKETNISLTSNEAMKHILDSRKQDGTDTANQHPVRKTGKEIFEHSRTNGYSSGHQAVLSAVGYGKKLPIYDYIGPIRRTGRLFQEHSPRNDDTFNDYAIRTSHHKAVDKHQGIKHQGALNAKDHRKELPIYDFIGPIRKTGRLFKEHSPRNDDTFNDYAIRTTHLITTAKRGGEGNRMSLFRISPQEDQVLLRPSEWKTANDSSPISIDPQPVESPKTSKESERFSPLYHVQSHSGHVIFNHDQRRRPKVYILNWSWNIPHVFDNTLNSGPKDPSQPARDSQARKSEVAFNSKVNEDSVPTLQATGSGKLSSVFNILPLFWERSGGNENNVKKTGTGPNVSVTQNNVPKILGTVIQFGG